MIDESYHMNHSVINIHLTYLLCYDYETVRCVGIFIYTCASPRVRLCTQVQYNIVSQTNSSLIPFGMPNGIYLICQQNVDHKLKFKSYKGQLPFVELNGEEIPDSTVIINKLSQHFGVDPDAQLTKDEKNTSHALISMIENHLSWVHVYWRSKNPEAMVKVYLNISYRISCSADEVPNVFFAGKTYLVHKSPIFKANLYTHIILLSTSASYSRSRTLFRLVYLLKSEICQQLLLCWLQLLFLNCSLTANILCSTRFRVLCNFIFKMK